MISSTEITGVILCGGAGHRLGRDDKPLTLLGDLPLVAHVRSRLAPQVKALSVSANQAHAQYAIWGDPVLADRLAGLGPLGGLATALAHCTTPYLFCCPGDAPFLPTTLVARLAVALESEQAELAVPHDGEHLQQLFILCRADVAPSLDQYLANGGRKVRDWIDARRLAVVDVRDERDGFLNINTEVDLQQAMTRLPSAGVSP